MLGVAFLLASGGVCWAAVCDGRRGAVCDGRRGAVGEGVGWVAAYGGRGRAMCGGEGVGVCIMPLWCHQYHHDGNTLAGTYKGFGGIWQHPPRPRRKPGTRRIKGARHNIMQAARV